MERSAQTSGRLLRELGRAGRRVRRDRLARHAVRVGGGLAGSLALALAGAILFPDGMRLFAMGAAFALTLGLVALVAGTIPRLETPGPAAVARLLAARDPARGERALAALELGDLLDDRRHGYSRELLERAFEQRASLLLASDLPGELARPPSRRGSVALAAGLAACLALGLASPQSAGRLARGVAALGVERDGGRGAPALTVLPGDCRVLAGDSLAVSATLVAGDGGERAADSGEPVSVEIAPGSPGAGGGSALFTGVPMTPAGGGAARYGHTFHRVMQPFAYRVRRGDWVSPAYRVELAERPRLAELALTLRYPDYTGEPARRIEESDGKVMALRGTRVEVEARASVPLASAGLAVREARGGGAPADTVALSVEGELAAGGFTVTGSGSWVLALRGADGFASLPGEGYPIVAVDDHSPYLRILRPGPDVTLDRELRLPLLVSAADDFGLGAVMLHYRVTLAEADAAEAPREGSFAILPAASPAARELRETWDWDLASLGLGPGDVVNYWLTVRDNDTVTGPKESATPVNQARFPRLEEVYQEVAESSERQEKSLEEIAAEQRELRENLEELTREAIRDKGMSWEEQQELQRALERQRQLQSRMDEVVQAMRESASQAENQDLFSREMIERMLELQQLLEEVATPEMREAMRRLQESMEQVSPEEMAQAMKELALNQEKMLERLERSIALLKRFQQEQKLEELVSRAEELLARQEAMLDSLDAAPGERALGEMATDEERIAAATEQLGRESEALAQELREQEPQAAEGLKEAAEELDAGQVPEELSAASAQMAQQNRQAAKSHGKRGESGLRKFRDQLTLAQSLFAENLRREITEVFRLARMELLALSLEQEDLVRALETDPRDRDLARGLSDRQQDLLGGLQSVAGRIVKVSEKTTLVNPNLTRALGSSLSGMHGALERLGQGDARDAAGRGDHAVVGLNEAVIELRRAQDQASSCQSPSGMPQFMQSMESMSCQQAGINQQTEALQSQPGQQPGGMFSAEQRASMARLAAEQQAVGDALEEAIRQSESQGRQVLGRMDETLEDMQRTMRELAEGRLTPDTVERQEKILSRLLDAQRSVRRRDHSQERLSRTGRLDEPPPAPGALPASLLSAPRAPGDELPRLDDERYPPSYEILIREYLRALRSGEAP